MTLSLRLLSRFELSTDAGVPVDVPGARVQLMLALLALSPASSYHREQLSSLFWGDRQEAQARASLRQSIWTLRRALAVSAPGLLLVEGERLSLDTSQLWVDVTAFEAGARESTPESLREAADLYRGDFLEQFDLPSLAPQGPFLERRVRLRELALDCLTRLADLETRNGQPEAAATAARRALQIDPLREDLHRALIILHMKNGRPAQALAQFDACRNVFREELGIEPSVATRAALRETRSEEREDGAVPAAHAPADPSPAAIPAPPAASKDVLQRPWLFPAAASLFAVFLLAGVSTFGTQDAIPPRSAPAVLPVQTPSVAVFPFADLSEHGGETDDATALTADLITDLSKVSGLFVLANDTTKSSIGGTAATARDLGAQYAVSGSIRRQRDMVRINVQLVDTATGHHVWAHNFDRSPRDPFAVQDEMVQSIVSALRVSLSGRERLAISRIPTRSLEAYDYYMRAEQQRLTSTEAEHFRKATAGYKRAIAIDPGFAEAYAGYARAAVQIWRRGFSDVMPGAVARRAAYEAAERALLIDPECARAYGVLSEMQVTDGEFESAVASARRAVTLQPGDADAHAQLAFILALAGVTREAVAEIEFARRLNPALPPDLMMTAGIVAFADRRYTDAASDLSRVRSVLSTSEVDAAIPGRSAGPVGRSRCCWRYRAKPVGRAAGRQSRTDLLCQPRLQPSRKAGRGPASCRCAALALRLRGRRRYPKSSNRNSTALPPPRYGPAGCRVA